MTEMISKYFSRAEVVCRCPNACGVVPGNKILELADALREGWGSGVRCVSGARCLDYTLYLQMHGIPAATRSAHIEGRAMDLRPVNGDQRGFSEYVKGRLEELGLRMEHPDSTPSWTHVDTRPVAPGKSRIFYP